MLGEYHKSAASPEIRLEEVLRSTAFTRHPYRPTTLGFYEDIKATRQVPPARVDRAAAEITAEATDWGADLIVLGFPRRGGLATRLFGSVTLSVLQHAPCPVLVRRTVRTDGICLQSPKLEAGGSG